MSSPLKAVVDHHVDRPDVEAPRGVQLTGTNRLIGLIAPIIHAHSAARRAVATSRPRRGRRHATDRSSLATRRVVEPVAHSATKTLASVSFAGLVALARSLNPIPSRTRPLNSSAPMVLCLKTWESRSSPGLPRTRPPHNARAQHAQSTSAGWSSPVARQAHNLKAAGSNPAPATISTKSPGPLNAAGAFRRLTPPAPPRRQVYLTLLERDHLVTPSGPIAVLRLSPCATARPRRGPSRLGSRRETGC